MVPGHEITGVVEQVGSKVKHFHVGDHVGVGCLVDSCLHCDPCMYYFSSQLLLIKERICNIIQAKSMWNNSVLTQVQHIMALNLTK